MVAESELGDEAGDDTIELPEENAQLTQGEPVSVFSQSEEEHTDHLTAAVRPDRSDPSIERAILGARIRAYRKKSGQTLKQLGTKTQLTESFLSQLERGKASASVASLRRITIGLGVTVADLFDAVPDESAVRVVRKGSRPFLPFGNEGQKFLLTPSHQKHLEIFSAIFESGGSTGDERYSHGVSEEFFLVLSGTFLVVIDDSKYILAQGDSLLFNSSRPHRAVNVGSVTGEVLWVISPPSF